MLCSARTELWGNRDGRTSVPRPSRKFLRVCVFLFGVTGVSPIRDTRHLFSFFNVQRDQWRDRPIA